MSLRLLPLLLALLLPTTGAAQVYKCQLPSGVMSYQEKPCTRGRLVKRIEVPASSRTVRASGVIAIPKPGAPNAETSMLAPVGEVPALPPPQEASAFRCLRADGSHYYSVGVLPRGQRDAQGQFVPDRCEAAEKSELCRWYAGRLAEQQASLPTLAGDARRQAERELSRLRAIHSHRCTGLAAG